MSQSGGTVQWDQMAHCAMCGHLMTLARCGYAAATYDDGSVAPLCHDADHDCYHAWTVYGIGPDDPWPSHGCGTDPRQHLGR